MNNTVNYTRKSIMLPFIKVSLNLFASVGVHNSPTNKSAPIFEC